MAPGRSGATNPTSRSSPDEAEAAARRDRRKNVDHKEDAIVLEPRRSIDHASETEAIFTGGGRGPKRELEPADLARTHIVGGRRGQPIRREPVGRQVWTFGILRFARAEIGLLIGDPPVPAT